MKNKIIFQLYVIGILITLSFPAVILSVCVTHLLAAGFSFTYLCCAICSVIIEITFVSTLHLGWYLISLVATHEQTCDSHVKSCTTKDCSCESKSEKDGD